MRAIITKIVKVTPLEIQFILLLYKKTKIQIIIWAKSIMTSTNKWTIILILKRLNKKLASVLITFLSIIFLSQNAIKKLLRVNYQTSINFLYLVTIEC